MPPAGDEFAEHRLFGGVQIDVELLWVVLLREGEDFLLGDGVTAERSAVADDQVLEIPVVMRGWLAEVGQIAEGLGKA